MFSHRRSDERISRICTKCGKAYLGIHSLCKDCWIKEWKKAEEDEV